MGAANIFSYYKIIYNKKKRENWNNSERDSDRETRHRKQ